MTSIGTPALPIQHKKKNKGEIFNKDDSKMQIISFFERKKNKIITMFQHLIMRIEKEEEKNQLDFRLSKIEKKFAKIAPLIKPMKRYERLLKCLPQADHLAGLSHQAQSSLVILA